MPSDSSSELKAEIGHVLFIDIVGYSKLLINEQTEMLEHLKQMVWSSEQVHAAESENKLITLPTGDGMALVFRNSPEAPARCALELTRADKEHPELQLRMGIHSGPINAVTDLNDRANVTGAGINMAQRVMDCGDAGHILLSKRAADDLREYRHWQPLLHELGECKVKHDVRLSIVNLYADDAGNAALPTLLAAQKRSLGTGKPSTGFRKLLVAAAIFIGLGIPAIIFTPAILKSLRSSTEGDKGVASSVPEKSIAVLPFENLSDNKKNTYFVEGIQDEVITRLAKIGELRVISRTSTQRYKTRPSNLAEIARELGVSHLVEGTVQRIGNRVRINVQLIRAPNESHLWAEIYDRDLTDIFAVQSELATRIAQSLQATLSGAERKAVAEKPTSNLAAYDAYLHGLDLFSRPGQTEENQRKAVDSYAEAVRLDPQFAQAWAALSWANTNLYFLQFDTSMACKEAARAAAETATRLSPSSPETLLANAYYRYHVERDYDGARLLFEKIQREMPSNNEAATALARIARRQSRWRESLRLFERVTELNPRDVYLYMDRAWTFSMLRQHAATADMISRALAISPDEPEVLVSKVKLLQTTGDLPGARAVLARIPLGAAGGQAEELRVTQLLWEKHYDEAARVGRKPDRETEIRFARRRPLFPTASW